MAGEQTVAAAMGDGLSGRRDGFPKPALLIKLRPRAEMIEEESSDMSGAVSRATRPQLAHQPTDVRAREPEPRPLQPAPSDTAAPPRQLCGKPWK